jgi:hypothetical protein
MPVISFIWTPQSFNPIFPLFDTNGALDFIHVICTVKSLSVLGGICIVFSLKFNASQVQVFKILSDFSQDLSVI